jgi:imidazoleglycerol-phosphate dehydratase
MADRTCPLDEALTQAVLDLSGRGYAVVNMGMDNNVGEFPADLARHFFEAIAVEGRFCLHIRVLAGQNEHHVIESAFKAFARAMGDASRLNERDPGTVPSTKGTLI